MRYKEIARENIPLGLKNFGEVCQSEKMEEEIEIQARDIYERILKKIKERLDESLKTLTQQEIADKCGVTQATISRIASGKRGKDLPFISSLKLALVLDIDLTTLYISANVTQEKIKTIVSEISKMIVND
jgi:predicted transcriptional regulator